MKAENNIPEDKRISLQEAAKYSKIYSQEYLSLRARQGKLKAVKFGRNWLTTKEWIDSYIKDESNVKANELAEDKRISLQEAAKYSKIYSQEYLSLRARQGKLKAVKFGRNWLTTKEWVDSYIKDENNIKANGVIYNFKSEKAEKETKKNFETVFIEAKQPAQTKEEAPLKDAVIFQPVFKENFFEKFSKNLIYSLGTLLVAAGLVFGFLIFKPFDIKIFTDENKDILSVKKENFINSQINFLNEAQNKFKETKNKADDFLQKIAFKENSLKWKNIFENTFNDAPEIYSQKTKEIFMGIKTGASHLASHSQRIKNIVLIFYDNKQHYAKTIWQGMLNAQKETSDYIVGFPLFIKDGIQANFLKIKSYSENSKIFLANAPKNISSFSKYFPDGTVQKNKNNYLGFADKAGNGIEAVKAVFYEAVFKAKDFAFYIHNKLSHGLYFALKPWNKENELVAKNDIIPKNEGGLIVIPSEGQNQDEKTKAKIRESFSDEIEVELKDADSGVITPVFKEKKGEGYMYLMVPVKN